jgi:SAM-dependent methyltransferase
MDAVAVDYARFHAPRYAYLLRLLDGRVPSDGRVLDVGWSNLTGDIHERFGVAVDALGFDADGRIASGDYYHFDLNDCQFRDRWRNDLPEYEVIVFAEVLEHLHTSPALVLGYLARHVKPGGSIIVQTPNAAAVQRRVKLLLGRNPYELIREDATNPGHFREYTGRELRAYAEAVGMRCERVEYRSYFDNRYSRHGAAPTRRGRLAGTLKNWLYPVLPPTWRPGLTAVLRKPAAQFHLATSARALTTNLRTSSASALVGE